MLVIYIGLVGNTEVIVCKNLEKAMNWASSVLRHYCHREIAQQYINHSI